MGSLASRPGNSLTILNDGFVSRLHPLRFLHECDPSYGFLLLPRWDCLRLNMPAFAGRTSVAPGFALGVSH